MNSMENKPPVSRSKGNKILRMLKKPPSFSISNHHSISNSKPIHHNKAFSGPLVPMEARKKGESRNFTEREPTSPKVSCMGQIKLKKSNSSSKRFPNKEKIHKSSSFTLKKMFNKKVRPRRRPESPEVPAQPPVGQLRKFTSGRDWLADFDWRKVHDDSEVYDDDGDEVIVPHSAPILIGGGGGVAPEPKKEVNLWKRRTLDPPMSLQVKVK